MFPKQRMCNVTFFFLKESSLYLFLYSFIHSLNVLFIFIYLCVCACAIVSLYIWYSQRPKRVILSPGARVIVLIHLIWVLGMKLRSFARATSPLSPSDISPVPNVILHWGMTTSLWQRYSTHFSLCGRTW